VACSRVNFTLLTTKRSKANCLLKYIIEGNIYGKEGEEEDVSCFWIILRARNALPREPVMLKVMDQTQGM
jgi:hypothetical protein